MNNQQIHKYLQRIQIDGRPQPTLDDLSQLQRQHALSVPFENLDIQREVPIDLSLSRFFEKIVDRHRGGFCYEINGLFYELLHALHFEVRQVSGSVYNPKKGFRQDFGHLAIIATFDQKDYLVDVGFGEFAMAPLCIETGKVQEDERGSYRITSENQDYFRVERLRDGQFEPVYRFQPQRQPLEAFEEMSQYQQSSPESPFTQKRLVTLPLINGRKTISGDTYKFLQSGHKESIQMTTKRELTRLLEEEFGITEERLSPVH